MPQVSNINACTFIIGPQHMSVVFWVVYLCIGDYTFANITGIVRKPDRDFLFLTS